jgi:hypothetical protein
MSVARFIKSTKKIIFVLIFAFARNSCTFITYFACSKVIQFRIQALFFFVIVLREVDWLLLWLCIDIISVKAICS